MQELKMQAESMMCLWHPSVLLQCTDDREISTVNINLLMMTTGSRKHSFVYGFPHIFWFIGIIQLLVLQILQPLF